MRRFRRSAPHDAVRILDGVDEPSAPPTTDSVSSRSAAPDSLTGLNPREQERLFSAFLDEIGAGERKRQTDFVSFCRSVEEAFDVAQAERRAQLRSIDHDIRAEAKEVHSSLLERAAAAETERDRLSAHCLSTSAALGMQLAEVGDRYAAIMGRLQCKIDMALTMGIYTTKKWDDSAYRVYEKLSKSETHLWALQRRPPNLDQPLDPHVPGAINLLTTEGKNYPGAENSEPMQAASAIDQHPHPWLETNILTRLLNGRVVPAAGMDPQLMRDVWLRRQEELDGRSLENRDHDFDALQSHLQSKFFAVLSEGSTISADATPSTLVIVALRWRTADARRAAGLKDIWATSQC